MTLVGRSEHKAIAAQSQLSKEFEQSARLKVRLRLRNARDRPSSWSSENKTAMAFKAFISPVTGWIAEWHGWPNRKTPLSPGELLRRIDVLRREVSAWLLELGQGKWVDPNYLRELVKVARYCLADAGEKCAAELRELVTLDLSEPEGFTKFFRTTTDGHWNPPDDPEYRSMQAQFDAKLTAEAERFERILRMAADQMLGVVPPASAERRPEFGSGADRPSAPNATGPSSIGLARSDVQSQPAVGAEGSPRAGPPLASSQYRAQLVATVIAELNVVKPQLFVPSDYARLRAEHPDYLTFEVTEANSDVRKLLMNIQAHRQHIRLATQIIAARTGKAYETIKIDWAKFKPSEFRRKPKLRT